MAKNNWVAWVAIVALILAVIAVGFVVKAQMTGGSIFDFVKKANKVPTLDNTGEDTGYFGEGVGGAEAAPIYSCYFNSQDWIIFNLPGPTYDSGELLKPKLSLGYSYYKEQGVLGKNTYVDFYNCPKTFVPSKYSDFDVCALIKKNVPLKLDVGDNEVIGGNMVGTDYVQPAVVAAQGQRIWATYVLNGQREFVHKDVVIKASGLLEPNADVQINSINIRYPDCDHIGDNNMCESIDGDVITPEVDIGYNIQNKAQDQVTLRVHLYMGYGKTWQAPFDPFVKTFGSGTQEGAYTKTTVFPSLIMSDLGISPGVDSHWSVIVDVVSSDGIVLYTYPAYKETVYVQYQS